MQDLSQWHRQFSSVSAALFVEVAAIAGSTGYPLLGAILVGIASALWTWFFIAAYNPPDREPLTSRNSFLRTSLALALAIILTSPGLLGYAGAAYSSVVWVSWLQTLPLGKPSQSLGSKMVRSSLHWRSYDDRPPVPETLSFDIPTTSAIRRFDEVTVVFHLDFARDEFGAKIGIARLVLVPRGL